MARIIPEIVVSNMADSMEFYSALGFAQDNEGIVDEHGSQWYSLAMDDSNVWLLRRDVAGDLVEGGMLGNGVHLYLRVDDVDATYEHLRVKGVPIVKEIETLWYGLREFKVADPDGYIWTINTPVTEQAEDSMDGGD